MANVRLFTREGCGLCDEALALVERELARALGPPKRSFAPCTCGPTSVVRRVEYADGSLLHVIDIDAEPGLKRTFSSEVPVVEVEGGATFKLTLDALRFSQALEKARTLEGPA